MEFSYNVNECKVIVRCDSHLNHCRHKNQKERIIKQQQKPDQMKFVWMNFSCGQFLPGFYPLFVVIRCCDLPIRCSEFIDIKKSFGNDSHLTVVFYVFKTINPIIYQICVCSLSLSLLIRSLVLILSIKKRSKKRIRNRWRQCSGDMSLKIMIGPNDLTVVKINNREKDKKNLAKRIRQGIQNCDQRKHQNQFAKIRFTIWVFSTTCVSAHNGTIYVCTQTAIARTIDLSKRKYDAIDTMAWRQFKRISFLGDNGPLCYDT